MGIELDLLQTNSVVECVSVELILVLLLMVLSEPLDKGKCKDINGF